LKRFVKDGATDFRKRDLKSIEEIQSLTHIERDDKRISCSPLISIIRAPPGEAKNFFISAKNHIKQGEERYE